MSRSQPGTTARLAWFRPGAPARDDPFDSTAALIDALAPHCDIDVIDARRAHEFVWQHDRRPYDLPVFELADTAASAFIWPYLLHYPGLLLARTRWLGDSRAGSLRRQGRHDDCQAERSFGGPTLLRAPLLASRMVVVAAAAHAQALQDEYHTARIRVAPIAIAKPQPHSPTPKPPGELVRFGVLDRDRLDLIQRALQRARDGGVAAAMLIDEPDRILREADAVLALGRSAADEWPVTALAAMAAGRPVVVLETEATADWPAWDPQTWQPRDPVAPATPIVISLDPRDEEHSLLLAMRRLAADPPWRAALGAVGHAWWEAHASPGRVVETWLALIEEAIALPAPAEPAGWPPHLRADGSRNARDILGQFGVDSDIFA